MEELKAVGPRMPQRNLPPSDALYPEPDAVSAGRLSVLDGWRAISILAVLAGHWLPLNAVLPGANDGVAAAGMAIFFTLSGFLITRFLLDRPDPRAFLIRRFLRILPLAWVAMVILYLFQTSAPDALDRLVANLLFYANLPPAKLLEGGAPLWSLCVEMQFYIGAALIVAVAGRDGLFAAPVIAVAVTLARILAGQTISIVTWHRIDEILAGATLALLYTGQFGGRAREVFARLNFWVIAPIAAICCWLVFTPLAYARPYTVAAMVGVTLFRSPRWVHRGLTSRPAAYVAEISYALYVIHGMLTSTWLGSGDLLAKYLKRPLLAALTLGLAHLSTYHFEEHFIALAKRLTRPPRSRSADAAQHSKEAECR